MNIRKEQAPDLTDNKPVDKTDKLGDPNFKYCHFEKGKGRDSRWSNMKDKGYEKAAEYEGYIIARAPKDEYEKRKQAARVRSESFLRAPDDDKDTISVERGPIE